MLLESCRRIIGIQWNVRATGFENGEHRHHGVGGAIQTESYGTIRANATVVQIMRQLIGCFIQCAIAEGLFAASHGQSLGSLGCLLLEEFVQALRFGILGSSLVPFDQKLMTLGFRKQRQL